MGLDKHLFSDDKSGSVHGAGMAIIHELGQKGRSSDGVRGHGHDRETSAPLRCLTCFLSYDMQELRRTWRASTAAPEGRQEFGPSAGPAPRQTSRPPGAAPNQPPHTPTPTHQTATVRALELDAKVCLWSVVRRFFFEL